MEELVLSNIELGKIITRAYNEGARQTLVVLAKVKASYSQHEAETVYGKAKFRAWVAAGKIYPMQRNIVASSEGQSKNRKKSYLIAECEKLLAAEEFKVKVVKK